MEQAIPLFLKVDEQRISWSICTLAKSVLRGRCGRSLSKSPFHRTTYYATEELSFIYVERRACGRTMVPVTQCGNLLTTVTAAPITVKLQRRRARYDAIRQGKIPVWN